MQGWKYIRIEGMMNLLHRTLPTKAGGPIKHISRVLQKLLEYFNGTAILTSFVLPKTGIFPVNFTLNLNDELLPGKLTILPLLSVAGSPLWYYHRCPNDFE